MRRVSVDSLLRARLLARPLYHESGALIFRAGERVEAAAVQELERAGIRRLYELGEGPDAAPVATAPHEPPSVPPEIASFLRERRGSQAKRDLDRALPQAIRLDRLLDEPRADLRNGRVRRVLARSATQEKPAGMSWRTRLSEVRPALPRSRRDVELALQAWRKAVAELANVFLGLRVGSEGRHDEVLPVARSIFTSAARDPDLALCIRQDGASEPVCPTEGGAIDLALARHSAGVAAVAVATGIELDLGLDQLLELTYAALLHDVGMLRVPRAVLAREGPLGLDERAELERHPAHALAILRRFDRLPMSVPGVAHHEHERLDGSGYPDGLQDPGYFARIVAVADVFEGLTTDRPDRPAHTPHQAVRLLVQLAARRQVDAVILRALLKAVGLYPVGTWIRIDDGRVGRVVRASGPESSRPLIAIAGALGTPPLLLALAEAPDIKIADPSAPAADPDPLALL